MAENHYMTQDGLDKLKKDLADALAQRPVISAAIAEAREKGEFLSKEDLIKRTQLSNTLVRKLEILGCLNGMQEENQMSLF